MIDPNLGPFLAVVDIGSNSVKYICVKKQRKVPGSSSPILEIIQQGSKVTRLAKNVAETGIFDPESLRQTEKTLHEMVQKFPAQTEVIIAATESARKVRDPKPLSDLVERVFHQKLLILDGNSEAELSSKGACAAAQQVWPNDVAKKTMYCFIEVGGGSAQIGYHLNSHFKGISFPFGAVTVFEKFHFSPDGTSSEELSNIVDQIKNEIQSHSHYSELKNILSLIKTQNTSSTQIRYLGIGGTLITTARALLDDQRVELDNNVGYTTQHSTLKDSVFRFSNVGIKERLKNPKIDPARVDIMPAGLLLFLALSEIAEFKDPLLITGWGLRHGIALKHFENHQEIS